MPRLEPTARFYPGSSWYKAEGASPVQTQETSDASQAPL
jgi:hypothetical protein